MSTATKKTPAKKKAAKAKAVEPKPAIPKVEPHTFTNGGTEVLILRRCNPDGTSHNGFKWPESGAVEAKDWRDDNECGGGLHGWAWGLTIGDGSDFSIIDDKWIVFAAKPEDVRAIGGKCKARRGRVVYCGDFATAWAQINDGRDALIRAMALSGMPNTSSGCGSQSASSGNYSRSASSGDCSQSASSGYGSQSASSGYGSQSASSGNGSQSASSGYGSQSASSGNYSRSASSGDCSRSASSGDCSRSASSGDCSQSASSGNYSRAAAKGKETIACVAGLSGMASAGDGGVFTLHYKDAGGRIRAISGYPGEDGIKADTLYEVRDGKLVEAE